MTEPYQGADRTGHPFDLYILGLGIVGVRQITREVDDALAQCREVLVVDSGFGVTDYIRTRCDQVTDLIPDSYREDEPRIEAYDRMATRVLEAALDHPPVAFAVYGHPLIYVYPSMQLRAAAELLGLRVQVLPGISALDAILVDIGLDPGFAGLQMFEATDVLLRDRYLQPDVPCLLWQVGAVESVLHSTAASTPDRFRRLQDHLLRFYPPDHSMQAVFASPHPLAPSQGHTLSVGELVERGPRLPHGATLYIPPIRQRPVLDGRIHQESESLEHLRRITRRDGGFRQPRDPSTPQDGHHEAAHNVVYDDFLTAQQAADLLQFSLDHEADFAVAQVIAADSDAGTVKADHRRALVLFDLGPHQAVLADHVRTVLPEVFEQLGIPPFQPTRWEAQLTASGDGSFFRVHNDNAHDLLVSRRVTFVYYFCGEPQAFTGGDLLLCDTRFHDGAYTITGGSEQIQAKHNRIVFFPSVLMHEVLPVSCPSGAFADSRFAVNGWVHDDGPGARPAPPDYSAAIPGSQPAPAESQ